MWPDPDRASTPTQAPRSSRRDDLFAYLGNLRAVQKEAIRLGLTAFGSQFDEPIAAARTAMQRAA